MVGYDGYDIGGGSGSWWRLLGPAMTKQCSVLGECVFNVYTNTICLVAGLSARHLDG